jgi:phospholipid/cholesterol/gamma-HCH transport system substrate-binding protein
MPQPPRWRNLTTGIFFLLSAAVLGTGILIVGTNQNFLSPTYHILTYLPDTQALAEGTSVTLSGITVGVIEDIALVTHDNQNAVQFRLRIKRRFQPRITTGSRGIVRSIGILGDKYLEITLGRTGEPMLEDEAVIPCEPAVDWEKVARDISGSITEVLGHAHGLIERIDNGQGTIGMLLSDSTLAGDLKSSLDRLDRTLAAVGERRGTLGRLIYDPGLYDQLSGAVRQLDQVATRLNRGEGTLGKLVSDSTLYDRATSAVAGLDTAMSRLNAGQGSAGRLMTDEALYDELRRTVESLRLLLADLQAHPGKYVHFSVF